MKTKPILASVFVICSLIISVDSFSQTIMADTNLAKQNFALGDKYCNSRSYDSSTMYYKEAARIYKKIAEKSNYSRMWAKYINCLYNISYNLKTQYRLDEDLIFLDSAVNLSIKYLGEKHRESAKLFNEIAEVHYYKGEYDEALKYQFRTLQILRELLGEKHPDVASSYGNIGNDYYFKGEYDKALEYHLKALDIRKEVLGENHPNVASSYGNLGNICQSKSDFDGAIEYFSRALQIFNTNYGENHKYVATCYNNIGNIYHNKGVYDKALENYNKALQIRIAILGEIHPDVAASYMNIGTIYSVKSEFKKSQEYQLKALLIRKEIFGEKHPDIATSYMTIGNDYSRDGDAEKALEYYFKALQLRKEILGEDHEDVARCYMFIGGVYNDKGEYDMALDYNFTALQKFKNIFGDSHPFFADIYMTIGRIYQNNGELNKALEYLFKALYIEKEILGEKHADVAYIYMLIGSIFCNKEEFDKALEYHFKALQIRQEIFGERHNDVAASYSNIGLVYYGKNENEKSLEYQFKALSIDKEILGEKHLDVAGIENNIGIVYYNTGEYDSALTYYFISLKKLKEIFGDKYPWIAGTYNNVGQIYYAKGDHYAAVKYYQKGIASCLRNFNDTLNIYSVPLITDYIDWGYLIQALLAKAQIIGDQNNIIQGLADNERKEIALRHYHACDTLIDLIRKKISSQSDKLSLGELANNVYKGAVDLLTSVESENRPMDLKNAKLKDADLAFYFSEKNKSSVLLEALAGQEAIRYAGIPESLIQKEYNLKSDINYYTKQLAETENSDTVKTAFLNDKLFGCNRSYDSLIAVFEKQFPEYHNLKYNNRTVSVEDIQMLLDKKTALRSYVMGDSTITIFTLTRNSLKVNKVPKISNLSDSIVWFRYGLTKTSSRMQEYYRRLGYKLHKQLFPDGDLINRKITKLIIIPDGELAIIPFESLLTSNYSGDINSYDQYPYLINKYNISYSYSSNLYYLTFSEEVSPTIEIKNLSDWLAFAPVFDNMNEQSMALMTRELQHQLDSLNTDSLMTNRSIFNRAYITPLPATKAETESIFKLFDDNKLKAKVLLHNYASEKFLKSGESEDYKILHFATHGFVNSEKPELSGLLLEQDTTGVDDGILYSGEIYNLKLNAELVVLSACETGLGKIQKGEGIIGLTRALLYAGAKNIIVSLWQVADESTSNLMVDFYENALSNKVQLPYSEALRNAKLKMIGEGDYAHPQFWSPFIIIGK